MAGAETLVGMTGAGFIGTGGLCGVGGFTIIEALDRGESSTKDIGEEAIVARAEVERADDDLWPAMGNGMTDGLEIPFIYVGYKDIGSVVAGDCGNSAGD